MKLIKTEDAVGSVLCHDMTQIIPGVTKDARFRKGHIVTEEDIPVLLSMGKENLYVFEKPEGWLHEDEAAERLLALCFGPNMTRSGAKEGKIHIQPAFIEISMKSRYSSDPDSAEMLDMIFNNRLVSAGYFYSNLDKMSIAHDVFWSKGDAVPDIASWYESEKGAEQARVDTINEFFAGGKK